MPWFSELFPIECRSWVLFNRTAVRQGSGLTSTQHPLWTTSVAELGLWNCGTVAVNTCKLLDWFMKAWMCLHLQLFIFWLFFYMFDLYLTWKSLEKFSWGVSQSFYIFGKYHSKDFKTEQTTKTVLLFCAKRRRPCLLRQNRIFVPHFIYLLLPATMKKKGKSGRRSLRFRLPYRSGPQGNREGNVRSLHQPVYSKNSVFIRSTSVFF